MKIAMIGQKGIPAIYGGIERHVEELVVRLAGCGEQVFVYTRPYYTAKKQKTFQGVNLISLPTIKTKHLDAITHTLFATIHALFQNYDIIHYHGVGPSLLCFIPRIFNPKAKVIVTFHCIDRQHQKWGRFAKLMLWLGERMACKFSHQVITVSRTLQNYCYEVFGRGTAYIPNGIKLVSNIKPSLITTKFDLKGQDYILTVARLIPHKGIQYLISAYQKIKTEKKLVIVGDSSFTDKYVKKLKHLASGNTNIIFAGYQSGQMLEELFSNAYVYVHASESEGLPIAVLEAASYGLPIIASNIPANMEIVQSWGLSFENKNVNELKEKLEYILKNPEEADKIGKDGRKYVLENYNWDDIIIETKNLYYKLTNLEICEDEASSLQEAEL